MTTRVTIKNEQPEDQSGNAIVLKQFYKDGEGKPMVHHQSDVLNPGQSKELWIHSGVGFSVEEGEYITYTAPETLAVSGPTPDAPADADEKCCGAPESCEKAPE